MSNESLDNLNQNYNSFSLTSSKLERLSSRTKTNNINNNARIQQNPASHFSNAFKKIQNMLLEDRLCDVKFLCNDKKIEIKAHRVVLSSISNYFYAMFTNNLAESFKTEIEIKNIDGVCLKLLIDYIYTGKIDLNEQNVFSIVSAANFLQLDFIVKHGCEYLCNNLKISNCISIYRFSDHQSLNELKNITYNYLLDNYQRLASNNELLNELNHTELEQLFDDECLNVSSEEFVYESLFKWLENDLEKRIVYLDALLAKVKLPLLKACYLTKEIETNKFITSIPKCISLMFEATIYHLIPEKFTTSPISRTSPRKSTVGYLLCVGGLDTTQSTSTASFIEKYDFRLDKWISFNSSINSITSYLSCSISTNGNGVNPNGGNVTNINAIKRLQFGVALLNSEYLYIVGGRDGLKTLNTVDCFNIHKETWTSSTPMITHRHGLQTTFLGNDSSILYAVGGHDGWTFLSTVERFDIESKTWSYVASMSNARSTLGIAVIGNILYSVGGRDANVCLNSVEYFNPLTNRWTTCSSMYKRRSSVVVTALNGFIYAIGGNENTSTLVNSDRFDCGEKYDPKNDQWTMITNIMKAKEAISASNLGSNYIFIAGGFDVDSNFRNECERFDPVKNEWTKIQSLNTPRAGACLIFVPPIPGNKLLNENLFKKKLSDKAKTTQQNESKTKSNEKMNEGSDSI